ncbi:uncharacterized protein F4812DRAFT_470697 [Daldinia caldariorum]|uniref:uncharacterized protein n=1 Tax=Daldinia caldariorum TaxID=326644 RepID=UPI0020080460|nr:uncharacterized protein F4812DRAFT_470697 [Daldinia caldariorum]KAI1468951.1 hypothetical protein F4812DRAFT_470697 [Daldinia caldariorum]
MADFSWLRLGQRSRTPSIPRTPTSPGRGPRQAASNLSLTSHSSLEPLTASIDASLFVREQDKIWYNPSLDQMVEALQVVLMTQGTLRPIPIKYNPYILHLIEGFANVQERIQTVDSAYVEARHSLEHHLEHFKSVADEWLEREGQYKAEIKRLEVLLSRTSSDGLEAVALARTNSVVDRNGPEAKQFVSRLKRLSTQTIQETSPYLPGDVFKEEPKPVPKVLDRNCDFLMSERIRRRDTVTQVRMGHLRSRRRYETATASSEETLKTERYSEQPTGPVSDKRPRPLFSDDISDASDMESRTETRIRPCGWQRKQARRQILEDLLDCETHHSGSSEDASLHLGKVHGRLSSYRLGEASVNTSLHLDDRRLRCLSGFSFVPGDDATPVLASGEPENALLAGAAAGGDEESDIELRKPDFKDGKENLAEEIGEELVNNLAISPESWETQWSSTAEKVRPQGSCASSLDTVVQATTGSPEVAAYLNSPGLPIAFPMPPDNNRDRSPSSAFESTSRRTVLSLPPRG